MLWETRCGVTQAQLKMSAFGSVHSMTRKAYDFYIVVGKERKRKRIIKQKEKIEMRRWIGAL